MPLPPTPPGNLIRKGRVASTSYPHHLLNNLLFSHLVAPGHNIISYMHHIPDDRQCVRHIPEIPHPHTRHTDAPVSDQPPRRSNPSVTVNLTPLLHLSSNSLRLRVIGTYRFSTSISFRALFVIAGLPLCTLPSLIRRSRACSSPAISIQKQIKRRHKYVGNVYLYGNMILRR